MPTVDQASEHSSIPRLPAHLYVHVPFCAAKCSYCDFYSTAAPATPLVGRVFHGIRAELERLAQQRLEGSLETVYVGGGTPSVVAAEVARTLRSIAELLPLSAGSEVTVEGNPDSLDAAAIEQLLSAGANRLSIGVQSFDDQVLRFLGRRHDAKQAWKTLEMAVASGASVSADLMCGVPGQSADSWSRSLERAIESGVRHLSVYPLSVESGTQFEVALNAGLMAEPEPDIQAEMMLVARTALGEAGFSRYEVANYAAGPRDESRHNTAYWTGGSYLGVGPAAHGMLDRATAVEVGLLDRDSSAQRVRVGNPADIEGWLAGAPGDRELLSRDEALREDVMLGLRLTRGVKAELVDESGLRGVLEGLGSDGLVLFERGRWRTTERGWLLGNEVFSRVWSGEE